MYGYIRYKTHVYIFIDIRYIPRVPFSSDSQWFHPCFLPGVSFTSRRQKAPSLLPSPNSQEAAGFISPHLNQFRPPISDLSALINVATHPQSEIKWQRDQCVCVCVCECECLCVSVSLLLYRLIHQSKHLQKNKNNHHQGQFSRHSISQCHPHGKQ